MGQEERHAEQNRRDELIGQADQASVEPGRARGARGRAAAAVTARDGMLHRAHKQARAR